MSTVEGLPISFALYPLPPGRLPLKRLRWELLHVATLLAACWRLSRSQAGRALRVHAAAFGHRLFGLPEPSGDVLATADDIPPGAAEQLAIGPITCLLVPRALDRPALLTG